MILVVFAIVFVAFPLFLLHLGYIPSIFCFVKQTEIPMPTKEQTTRSLSPSAFKPKTGSRSQID
jgi:hypothetical protein